MSPLRRDQNGIQSLPSWESWIDEVLAEARERGEFDDLPGAGQPLRITENPFAGEWEMAFHVLENADMAPPWMEMSREIRAGLADLREMREQAARYLSEQLNLAQAPEAKAVGPSTYPRHRFRWWPFPRRQAEPAQEHVWRPDRAALEAMRLRARRDYLERAAQLDEIIVAYNGWLPDNLRRLQKPRLKPDRAAQEFDAACPPVTLEAIRP
jgi:DnaJ homolog subfamily C member 28